MTNRIIKFRAWNPDLEEMIDNDLMFDNQNPFTRGDYEIMQFTGLLDKNGKEIYEGDIVSVKELNKEEKCTEVKFEKGCWVFKWGKDNLNQDWDIRFGYWIDKAMEMVEVIGNIYENKELLK